MEMNQKLVGVTPTTTAATATQNGHHNNTNHAAVAAAAAMNDALIINSNSNVVSEEIVLQLQEQFGDSKQIYILNTSTGAGSTAAANSSSNSNSGGLIQYLVVDKDVDINVLLQDPNIFQAAAAAAANTSTTTTSNNTQVVSNSAPNTTAAAPPSSSHSAAPAASFSNHVASKSNVAASSTQFRSSSTVAAAAATAQQPITQIMQNQVNDIEESIVRVEEAPPRRKKIDYQPSDPSGKPSTYQEAFIRFLTLSSSGGDIDSVTSPNGELSTTTPSRRQHPRDKIYHSFFANSTLASSSSSSSIQAKPIGGSPSSPAATTNTTTTNSALLTNAANTNTTTTTATATLVHQQSIDKENYYNSSRRENLTPLNTCEYRNSYKDVYDNQGVRVNPAIIKSLAAAAAATSSSSTASPNTSTVPLSKSSITVTKNSSSAVVIQPDGTTTTANVILADHTYKTTTAASQQVNQNKPTIHHNNDVPMEVLVQPAESTVVSTSNPTNQLLEAATTSLTQVTFAPGEFLIHKATFSGDLNNYDLWCVLDASYLQKYEPVMLLTGERCHQSTGVYAQYSTNKDEFLLMRVEEKGRTESDNVVVAVLADFEPKNNPKIAAQLTVAS